MKNLIHILSFLLCASSLFAQSFTINPQGASLTNASSTTQGILIPRMTLAQRNNIPLSAGLQVFCSDCSPAGHYSFDGSNWLAMLQTTTVIPTTYTVGQAAQGGIVFWIDPNSGGQHGLAVAPTDQTAIGANIIGVQWLNGTYIGCGAFAGGYYGGQFNTEQIINAQGMGMYAAQLCRNINIGLYGDWYLPSIEELRLLYTLKNMIGGFDVSGTAPSYSQYWSSTEVANAYNTTPYYAFSINFANGTVDNLNPKYNVNRVRAIRRF